MARPRLKLAHEREILRLRATKTQHRIRIADSRDAIKRIDAELATMKPKKRNDLDPGAA